MSISRLGTLIGSPAALVAMVLILVIRAGSAPQAPRISGPPDPPSGRHWKLIWSDEFEGTTLDPTKWNLPGDFISRHAGAWSNSRIKVGGGVVRFHADLADGKVVSAAITSENHLEVTYGYFEVRAALPRYPGYRPAFWISAKNINNVDDPRHPTEMDVMEYPLRNEHVTVNLHWNGYGAYHRTTGSVRSPVATPPGEFHRFGVWWSTTGYKFYVDGQRIWTSNGGGISTCPEFMKLGNDIFEPENIKAGTEAQILPPGDDFTVDYVRVYQLE